MDDFLSALSMEIQRLKGSKIKNLTLETPLREIGIDSLDLVELMFQVETRYGITIPFEGDAMARGADIKCVGDIKRFIDEKLKPEGNSAP
jgi:acyl carrier protein